MSIDCSIKKEPEFSGFFYAKDWKVIISDYFIIRIE